MPGHLLSLQDLDAHALQSLLNTADTFLDKNNQIIQQPKAALQGKTVANLFFEPSTRTRSTFELAAKRLGAHVLNLSIQDSATKKGEALQDTLHTLQAMQCELFVVRHPQSGAAHFIAQVIGNSGHVINAGDGTHAHPTQALLDMLTIKKHKPNFSELRVAIVGDILHSRVARSEIQALSILGVPEIRVIAPQTLLPSAIEKLGVHVYHDLHAGLKDADIVMVLRLQRERMHSNCLPKTDYYSTYRLTPENLKQAKPDAIVMHPGPINRDIEIDSQIVSSSQSVILQQVTYGIAVRMAVMSSLVASNKAQEVA